MQKKLLVIDCGLERGPGGKTQSKYVELTILRLARKRHEVADRFILLERPRQTKQDVEDLFRKQQLPYAGVIISGSAILSPVFDSLKLSNTITNGDLNSTVLEIIEYCAKNGIPLLGICYGFHMIGRFIGEEIVPSANSSSPLGMSSLEFGFVEIRITEEGNAHPLFLCLPKKLLVAEFHSDRIEHVRHGKLLARNKNCVQALGVPGTNITGIQFHAEFNQDKEGEPTALQYLYARYGADLRLVGKKDMMINPPNPQETYALNNEPLLRFMDVALA